MSRHNSLNFRALFAPKLGALFGLMLILAPLPGAADDLTGVIEKVEKGGSIVVISGKLIAVSGSRTNICIKGACDKGRDQLKAGMTCADTTAARKGAMEARRLSCK